MTGNEPNTPKTKGESPASQSAETTFHFIKPQDYRIIHVDGAFGGISPQGHFIHMAVYSERFPIPQQIKHKMEEGGKVGDEIVRLGREGVIREIQADLIFNVSTAERIVNWLQEKIDEHKRVVAKESKK